jgi:hypothetical protein
VSQRPDATARHYSHCARAACAIFASLTLWALPASADRARSHPVVTDPQLQGYLINNYPGGPGTPYVSVFEILDGWDIMMVHEQFDIVEPHPGWSYVGRDVHIPHYQLFRRPQAGPYRQVMTAPEGGR